MTFDFDFLHVDKHAWKGRVLSMAFQQKLLFGSNGQSRPKNDVSSGLFVNFN